MKIEEKIREEMMRLQELMKRLEDFKSRHKTTEKCAEDEHLWVENGNIIVFGTAESYAYWKCDICGMRAANSYSLQNTIISDPWSDLREDEEE